MTDELIREAAERLRRMRKESYEFDGGYPATDEGRRQSLHDHVALAEAYLSEHRADDHLPVDEAWLRSVGFGQKWGDPLRYSGGEIDMTWKDDRMSLAWRSDEWCDLPGKTRGDVRNLAKALGITLKE